MKDLEKSLKRFLKRKIKVTTAVVVSFLITGAIGYAAEQELIPKSEDTEVLLFLNGAFSKLENDKIKDINKFKLGNNEIKPPVISGMDIIKPGEPGGPTTTKPGMDIIKPGEPGGPITKPTEPEKPQGNINTENKVQENGIIFDIKEGESFTNKGNLTLKSDVELVDKDKDGLFESYKEVAAVIQNNGGTVINEGKLKVEGLRDITFDQGTTLKIGEGVAVYQTSGNFVNKGEIYVEGNGNDAGQPDEIDTVGGYGVMIEGGTATNEGTITSKPSYEVPEGLLVTYSVGMKAFGGTIKNGKNGVIENQLVSMYAIGSGSSATNDGIIKTHNTGMLVANGATGVNNGRIEAWWQGTENFEAAEFVALDAESFNGEQTTLINGKDGVVYGAVQALGGAATVKNYGTIHGTEIKTMNGNIENYGTITGVPTNPNGVVITGNGKFIQGVDGKLEAEKVDGDIYLAGDYAKNNYSDEIKVNTDNISIKEHNGEIKSNSVMYKYNSDDKTLDRKNFNEIVQNSAIADYLENNYVDGDILRQEIFNNLKAIDNNKDFNKATNNLFGNDIYPNMTRQTMDMINFNKQVMIDNIFNVDTTKDLRVIGGLDYKNIDTKSSNLSGYDEDIKAVFFGADKALSKTQRIGAIANVGTLESKYDMNNAKREDTFFQGNIYHTYNKNNFSLTNNLFAGISSGDVERDIKFVDVEGHSKGDLDNKWIGLQNIASYRFDTDYFFFKPKLEANFTYLMQDSIKENGNYGLEIEKANNWSIEGGTGFEIGKDLYFNDYRLTFKAGGNIYHEFANPYDGTDVKLRNISADTLKLADNDNDTRKDVSLRVELEKNNSVGIYGEYKYMFDDEKMFQVGMNYRF